MKLITWIWVFSAAGASSSLSIAQEAAVGADALAASTTLSGYISTSYTFSDEDGADLGKTNEDADKFKLDIVSLTLGSAQGAGEYAAGYTVGMWLGPDDQHTSGETVSLTQANIDLRVPIGTGLNLKVGYFGKLIGYEVYEYTDNAFFQRGVSFFAEPTHHTGILASYQINDDLELTAGVINDGSAVANNNQGDSDGAYAGAINYTAPSSLGFASGTSIYMATIQELKAFNTNAGDFWYTNIGLPTGIKSLSIDLGAKWIDWEGGGDDEIYQIFASYELSKKSTLNGRYEWGTSDENSATNVKSLAVGLNYDLWDNVISRVEYLVTSVDLVNDDKTLAINLIYSF